MADTNDTPETTATDEPGTDQAPLETGADGAQGESLEGGGSGPEVSQPEAETAAGGGQNTAPSVAQSTGQSEPSKDPPKKSGFLKRLFRRVNIYLLMFIFIVLLAGMIILISYRQNQKPTTDQIKTQGLSQSTLEQLANSDVSVGSKNTVLNVKASAIFAGQVLVKEGLEVAGNLKVGGTTALSSLDVSGTSQLGQTNVSKDLAVTGNTAIQGTATVSKSLQVGGGGTFHGAVSAPQITTGSLQLNGDLVLTHHITIGGSQPGRSGGSALGSGGSSSVSGSDTAGSIRINTGSGPAAGCFVTINFTSHFNATPHVLITPIGSAAGSLDYYVNRTPASFSICDSTTPPSGSSFGFDYFVLD